MNEPVNVRCSLMPMLTKNIDFGARCEDADPFVCSREVLQELIDDSPGDYELGFLSGIFQFREQLAILTEIEFV